jgi:CBS-domain-containing membrane protein
MTLLYGLTAAPAAQPRNALAGQALSMAVSIGVSYAGPAVPAWLRQSLAASLSIAAMVRLGITHPPAGASALVLATEPGAWPSMAATLLGNVVAIGMAAAVNNLSPKRQYPLYWGLSPSPSDGDARARKI